MGVSKEEARVLGLTKNEQVLLRVLEDGPFRISQLTQLSGLPRMTVYSVLSALMKRGFVIKARFGRYWRYTLGAIPSIASRLPHANEAAINGVLSIAGLYEKMFRVHAEERVQVIQGAQSWKRVVANVSLQLLNALNASIKQNRIILEAIVSASIVDLSAAQKASWKRNMEGRTTGVTLVPDEVLDSRIEVWIFSDTVLLTDWSKELCHVLDGADATRLFTALFNSFQGLGKRFDANAFLRAHM